MSEPTSTADSVKLSETAQAANKVPTSKDVQAILDAEKASKTTTDTVVPLENRIAELNRKTEKQFTNLNSKIEQLLSYVNTASTQASQAQTAATNTISDDDFVPKAYVDARFAEKERKSLAEQQKVNYGKAKELFPELVEGSEGFDPEFYKLADSYYTSINQSDPEAPLKAVKLAALDLGKIEKLTKKRVLDDDSRRTRLLEEGGIAPKQANQPSKLKMNESRLQSLLGVDPDKVRARIKANPTRYSTGKGE